MRNIYGTNNLPRTLNEAATDGGWRVLGAALGDQNTKSADIRDVDVSIPSIIVLGNEGKGLRTTVSRACVDGFVNIGSAAGAPGLLDSLNVSVAGGILMHYMRQGACGTRGP